MKATRPQLFALMAALILSTGCSTSEAAKAPPAPPAADVEVVTVSQHDVPIYGEWVGTLDGFTNAGIKAQVSGYLIRQDYHEGEFVHQGHLLFELDPRPLEAALSQAEAQVSQAHGQLAQATSQEMQAQAGLSQAHSQEMTAEAALSQAQSQLQQAQAGLAQARALQGKAQLDVDKYQPLVAQDALPRQALDNAVQSNLAAQAQVESARAQIGSARATIAAARAQVSNAHAAVAGAQAQIGNAHAAVLAAQGQVQAAEALVKAATLNLGFTRIAAPIDGIAGLTRAQVGDLVGPSTEILTTVSKLDPIKVYFTLPEQEYIEFTRRHPSEVSRRAEQRQMTFELISADGTVYPHRGRFFAEDRNVADGTGAIRMAATFPNPGGTLRPGQYARVRAIRYVKKQALMVPQRAVSELLDHSQVAVVGPKNTIDIRTVQLGERIDNQWIVDSGLQPGDRVVAEGTMKVAPGAAVNPKPYAPPAAGKH